MATTTITDIYNPLVFARLTSEAQINTNAFIQSGIMTNDPALAAMAAVGGDVGVMTGYAPMVNSEPRYSNDTQGGAVTSKNVTSIEMNYRKWFGNESWSFMEMAKMVNLQQGIDPITAMNERLGQYWASNNESRVIQSSLGVLADSVASHGSDMLITVATDGAGAITAAERISADLVLDTKQTLGDHSGKLNAIGMHSVIYTRLQKENLIEFIPDSRGEIMIPPYLGYRVIQDDNMPAVAGSNRITYTTILFAAGAFGYADVPQKMPSELVREAASGNGGGEDIIYSRHGGIIQPMGMSFNSSSVAGQSASWTELANAANWTRAWDRKNIPLAFLQTNG